MVDRNLYISGELTPERVHYIKEAKARIDPGWFTRLERYAQGTDAPLIAFQLPPVLPTEPWAWAPSVDSTARMKKVLRALWFGENADRLYGEAEWLSMAMGVEIKEIGFEVH